jgi:hypothetical protein
MHHRLTTVFLGGALAIAVAACASGSTASSTLPSAAAPSAAASLAAPSQAAPSEATPSEATASTEPSFALPSIAFPSTDKELEALIPNTMCGATVIKLSMSGASFGAAADPEFKALLDALGKSPSDVTFAAGGAGNASRCAAGIFRIKGVDTAAFQRVFLAGAEKNGDHYTETSIAGKTVFVDKAVEGLQYGYFKGDALIFAAADTDAHAAEVIGALP